MFSFPHAFFHPDYTTLVTVKQITAWPKADITSKDWSSQLNIETWLTVYSFANS